MLQSGAATAFKGAANGWISNVCGVLAPALAVVTCRLETSSFVVVRRGAEIDRTTGSRRRTMVGCTSTTSS
jgi:hypothetical protein